MSDALTFLFFILLVISIIISDYKDTELEKSNAFLESNAMYFCLYTKAKSGYSFKEAVSGCKSDVK